MCRMSTRHRSTTGSPLERHRTVRGHHFYPPAEVLARIPGLYGTEPVPTGDKTIWLHYFAGPCDWWVAEYDPASGDAFGYACLGDPDNAEWATPTSPTSKPCTPLAASPPAGRPASSGCCPGCWSNATWIGPRAPSPPPGSPAGPGTPELQEALT